MCWSFIPVFVPDLSSFFVFLGQVLSTGWNRQEAFCFSCSIWFSRCLLRSCSAGRLCSRFLSDLQSDFSVRILRAPSPSWAATGFAFPSRAVLVGLRLLTKSSLRFDSRLVYVAGLSPHIHSADTWSLSLLGSPSPVSILVFPQSISWFRVLLRS
jgi:hypothetical protein